MTQRESRDYLELSYRAIECFADDGTLLPHELDRLLSIAMRDGVVDANERRVLLNIISRLKPEELTPEMQHKVDEVRQLIAASGAK